MFKKKTSTTEPSIKIGPSPVEQVLGSYTQIANNFYYKKVSLSNLAEIKNEINFEIPLLKKIGIAVVLIDGKLRKEYLVPGMDPYQARKDLNDLIEKEEINKALADRKAAEKSSK